VDHARADAGDRDCGAVLDLLEPVSLGDAHDSRVGHWTFQPGPARLRRDNPVAAGGVDRARRLLRDPEFLGVRREASSRTRAGGPSWLHRSHDRIRPHLYRPRSSDGGDRVFEAGFQVKVPPAAWAALVVLLAAVIGLQMIQAAQPPLAAPEGVGTNLLYVRSPQVLRRATLSFQALLADIYWIRAVQHYGGTKLSNDPNKQYDVLYPLLDLTTSLDPYFDVVYKFGSVFLAETYPAGAGRPDQAIALLQKGLRTRPDKWELAQEVGFVYYWWLGDYQNAAMWFNRAADMPKAPDWLRPLAAVTLAQGGNRASSRVLWTEIGRNADAEWLRDQASFRLKQLDALD